MDFFIGIGYNEFWKQLEPKPRRSPKMVVNKMIEAAMSEIK